LPHWIILFEGGRSGDPRQLQAQYMRGARGARVLTPASRSALGSRFSAHCRGRGFASGASLGRALPVSSPRFEPLDADKSGNWGNNQRGLGHNNYLAKILNARVYEAADETPLQRAPALSAKTRNHVHLKREDLQPVRSFKIRGAYNKVAQLSHEQRSCGIVACSAGNHAQGVAFSAIKLGIDAVIVMPTGTPSIKVDGVRKLGGRVVLHGDTYDEAAAEAARLVEVEGRTLIHPFDDPLVIAGLLVRLCSALLCSLLSSPLSPLLSSPLLSSPLLSLSLLSLSSPPPRESCAGVPTQCRL